MEIRPVTLTWVPDRQIRGGQAGRLAGGAGSIWRAGGTAACGQRCRA